MATANKYNISVVIKTAGGTTHTFADASADGSGAAVVGQLQAKQSVDSIEVSGETERRVIIPFSSVDDAIITVEQTTVDAPVDANCEDSATPEA